MNFNTLASGLGIDGLGGSGYSPAASPIEVLGQGSIAPSAVNMAGMPTQGFTTNQGFAASMGGPLGVASLGLSALSSLGSLWMGLKAQKLAKKQFKFTKDVTNTNLANQIQSYNTALADRARSRGVMEGQSQGQVDNYITTNSLNRNSGKVGPTSAGAISSSALSNYSQYVRPGEGYRSSQTTSSSSNTDDDDNG